MQDTLENGSACCAEKCAPNILFILADDLGWPDVSCYGQTRWKTPNIDRLAEEGMLFTDAYAASPVCSPTRASILTGKYPHRTGLTGILEMADLPYKVPTNAAVLPAMTENCLSSDETTLAEALRDGGYATAMVGKWHVGGHPKDHGFDSWPCFSKGNARDSFVDGRFFTDIEAEAAVNWIGKQRERPFFLYFSTHAVHTPIKASRDYIQDFLDQGLPKEGPWNATYAAYVRHLDDAVGTLMDAIDSKGLSENTLVIFFSDNGGRGLNVSRNDPLRGAKGQLYDGGDRVPLLVRWPGMVEPGSRCETPVISNDFYPSLLESAALPMRLCQHVDGVSILPLLTNTCKLQERDLFWHHPHYSTVGVPHSSIRSGDWKLIRYYSDYRREWNEAMRNVVEWHEKGRCELFNLKNDLSESANQGRAENAIAAELENKLQEHLENTGARMPPCNPDYDPNKPETGIFEM